MLGYSTIENYYRLTFDLVQHHKYSIEEVENLIPFERDLYVDLLIQFINEENKRLSQ